MAKRVPPVVPKRLVWRISESAPLGEYVEPDKPAKPAPKGRGAPESSSASGWIVSSFELLNGIDVTESSDTVTDDVFDELFAPPPPPPKRRTDEK